MTWLVHLYPPRWRERYGPELVDLLSHGKVTWVTFIDVIAGAIDAWLNPQLLDAVAHAEGPGGKNMIAKTLRWKCAGYGERPNSSDVRKSLFIMLGGTLGLTFVWFAARRALPDQPWIESLSPLAFFVPLLWSQKYTSLKGRSSAVQWVFIGGQSLVIAAMLLVAAWVASRI